MLKRKSDQELAGIVRSLLKEVGEKLDADLSIRLWDGSLVPLGPNVTSGYIISFKSPGVIASLIKGPSLDKLIRHYIHKNIDFEGGTFFDIGKALAFKKSRRRLKEINKKDLLKKLSSFLLVPFEKPEDGRSFKGDESGENKSARDEKKYIEFHYDVSNEFYKLFLDERMVYSCAYFTKWDASLNQAQHDKLDMICRKLRLNAGETMLDIGCGWGSLLIHAVENYSVIGTGVTLATEQYEYALARIKEKGIEDKITLHLMDYRELDGKFDKISSIGMYEHVGIDQVGEYLSKVRSLLKRDGLFLNHGITRRGKKRKKQWRARPEKKAIQKYIFPGGDLDSIGNTIANMEQCGFEVHDVEGWRMHYQKTTELWCKRLTENKEEAIKQVGEETYRIWVAYLAGVSLSFLRGSMRIYQTLATENARGLTSLPPTREDLYR